MKIVLTGKSGFLGARILRTLEKEHIISAPTHEKLNITDERACMEYLEREQPELLIHTAAISDTGVCEKNPELSYQVNVEGTVHLAKACREAGSRLIFMSSDQVYNGNPGVEPSRETMTCSPVNVYGRHKLLMEEKVLALLPDAIGLRLTWMYDLPGALPCTRGNFLINILHSLEQKKAMALSPFEYRGVTWTEEVAENLCHLFDAPGGIYNFGSENPDTFYELGKKVYGLFPKEKTEGLLCRRTDAPPRNIAMSGEKAAGAGVQFSDSFSGICRCLKTYEILDSQNLFGPT